MNNIKYDNVNTTPNRKRFDILICNDDKLELPVHIVDTIEEASIWLDCSIRTLYNTKHINGYMHYNGYKLELVKREA